MVGKLDARKNLLNMKFVCRHLKEKIVMLYFVCSKLTNECDTDKSSG